MKGEQQPKIGRAELEKMLRAGAKLLMLWEKVSVEQRKLQSLLDLRNIERGRILTCVLVIEHYLNLYLIEHGIITEKQARSTRGSITGKLVKLKKHNPRFTNMCSGLRRIVNIRHQFAHNLEYRISEKDVRKLEPINAWVDSKLNKDDANYSLKTIENYTEIACFYLIFYHGSVSSSYDTIASEHPGVGKFFSEIGDFDLFDPANMKIAQLTLSDIVQVGPD